MNDQLASWIAIGTLGLSIVIVIYVIWYMYRQAEIEKEKAVVALGEKEIEDTVNSMSSADLIASVDKELSSDTTPTDGNAPKK